MTPRPGPATAGVHPLLLLLPLTMGLGLLGRTDEAPPPLPAVCASPMPAAAPPPGGVDFNVTVVAKTAAHPQFGVGISVGFAIDGIEGRELFLVRGTTYTFNITGGHPFAFSTSVVGGPANIGLTYPASNGITGTPSTGGVVTFTPNASYPNLIYYVCNAHNNMGWKINISDPLLQLSAKVFLDGPYVQATQLMNDALRSGNLVPTGQPYTALGYPAVTGTTTSGVLAVTGSNAIVDWMVVELRDNGDPSVVVDRRTALLQRDGDLVDMDGTSPLTFAQPDDLYYVAVRHRNHLGVMTQDPVSLSTAPTALDLSDPGTGVAGGTDARKDVGGTMVLWSGDVTFSGQVQYTGAGNDRDAVLSAIGGVLPTNTITGQYRQEDLNLDAQVKYTGSANDRDIILSAIGGSVPTNVRADAIP